MRYVLGFSLLLSLCAAASAATVHHVHRQHAVRANAALAPASAVRSSPQYGEPSPYDNRYPNWGGM